MDKLEKYKNQDLINRLIQRLLIEHKKNDKSGIYGITQYTFSYNSNHIEGSTLTKEQTRSLFDTGTILNDFDILYAKDIEEATGHFMMFNEMLHTYNEDLTEDLIKKYHFRLKQGVFEDMANGYPYGEYKNRPNRASDIITAKPHEVPLKMAELLNWYKTAPKTCLTILEFHARYETIHPFQDGNGRTGRIIMFKECLKYGYVPILIKDKQKIEYKLALDKAQKVNDYEALINIILSAQEDYLKLIEEYVS